MKILAEKDIRSMKRKGQVLHGADDIKTDFKDILSDATKASLPKQDRKDKIIIGLIKVFVATSKKLTTYLSENTAIQASIQKHLEDQTIAIKKKKVWKFEIIHDKDKRIKDIIAREQ